MIRSDKIKTWTLESHKTRKAKLGIWDCSFSIQYEKHPMRKKENNLQNKSERLVSLSKIFKKVSNKGKKNSKAEETIRTKQDIFKMYWWNRDL